MASLALSIEIFFALNLEIISNLSCFEEFTAPPLLLHHFEAIIAKSMKNLTKIDCLMTRQG